VAAAAEPADPLRRASRELDAALLAEKIEARREPERQERGLDPTLAVIDRLRRCPQPAEQRSETIAQRELDPGFDTDARARQEPHVRDAARGYPEPELGSGARRRGSFGRRRWRRLDERARSRLAHWLWGRRLGRVGFRLEQHRERQCDRFAEPGAG